MSYTVFRTEMDSISTYNTEELKERNSAAIYVSTAIAIVLGWAFADPQYHSILLINGAVALAVFALLGLALNQWRAAARHEAARKTMIAQIKIESIAESDSSPN